MKMTDAERAKKVRITLPPGAVVNYSKLVEVNAPKGLELIARGLLVGKAAESIFEAVRQAGGTVEYI